MTPLAAVNDIAERQKALSAELFKKFADENYRRTARVFAALMAVQWLAAILVALFWSPYGWAGKVQTVNLHLPIAVFLGGAISLGPIVLAFVAPASPWARHLGAVAQMLYSALFIHLTGGRIETHFHVFGSLAFIAFYRDWKVLIPATLVVAGDHLVRGIFWPESVYGQSNTELWRFVEHASWVVFENIILVLACLRGMNELKAIAHQQAQNEVLSDVERARAEQELARVTDDLNKSHEALLKSSQEALARSEKLAAIGQLAASVGHELRNPLGAVRNGTTYISKRVMDPKMTIDGLRADKRLPHFFQVIEHELNECARIISDLLDFAREKAPERRPAPLRPIVQNAIGVVPVKANVELVNDVPENLPVPQLDGDQFRQVLSNLVQNGSEAIPADKSGRVVVSASGGGSQPWQITVADNGSGMPADVAAKVFQPLFTTKTKGTGLGLAIVKGLVQRHGGNITVDSVVGQGTTFTICLPADAMQQAA